MSDIRERLSQWYAATGAPAYKEGADEIERLRAINVELLAALDRTANQPLSSELIDDARDVADFEGGYDTLIREARAAIAKAKP